MPQAEPCRVPLSHVVFVCICAGLEQKWETGSWGGEAQTQPVPVARACRADSELDQPHPSAVTHRWVFWGVKSHGLFGGLFLRFGYFALFSFVPHPGKGLMLQAVHTKLREPREMLPAAALLPFFHACSSTATPRERTSGVGGCLKATGRTEVFKAKGSYGRHTCTPAKIIYINDCNAIAWRGALIPPVSFVSPARHRWPEAG